MSASPLTVSSALRMALVDWVSTRREPDWDRLVAVLGSSCHGGHARRLLTCPRLPLPQARAVLAVHWPASRPWAPLRASAGAHSGWHHARSLYGARPSNLTVPFQDWDTPSLEQVFAFRADPSWPRQVATSGWLDRFVQDASTRPDVALLLHADSRLADALPLDRRGWALPQAGHPVWSLSAALDPVMSAGGALRVLRHHENAIPALHSGYGSDPRSVLLGGWVLGVVEGTGDAWLAQRVRKTASVQDPRLEVLSAPRVATSAPDGVTPLARLATSVGGLWSLVAHLDAAFVDAAHLRAAIAMSDGFEGTAKDYLTCVKAALAP